MTAKLTAEELGSLAETIAGNAHATHHQVNRLLAHIDQQAAEIARYKAFLKSGDEWTLAGQAIFDAWMEGQTVESVFDNIMKHGKAQLDTALAALRPFAEFMDTLDATGKAYPDDVGFFDKESDLKLRLADFRVAQRILGQP